MKINSYDIIRLIDRAIDTNPSLKEHQDNFQILGTLNELKNKLIKSISFEVILNSEERQTMGYLKLHYKN